MEELIPEEYEPVKPIKREITFATNANNWIIKMDKDGIHFNVKDYPNSTPYDFAMAFIELMENNFSVSFKKKSNQEKNENS